MHSRRDNMSTNELRNSSSNDLDQLFDLMYKTVTNPDLNGVEVSSQQQNFLHDNTLSRSYPSKRKVISAYPSEIIDSGRSQKIPYLELRRAGSYVDIDGENTSEQNDAVKHSASNDSLSRWTNYWKEKKQTSKKECSNHQNVSFESNTLIPFNPNFKNMFNGYYDRQICDQTIYLPDLTKYTEQSFDYTQNKYKTSSATLPCAIASRLNNTNDGMEIFIRKDVINVDSTIYSSGEVNVRSAGFKYDTPIPRFKVPGKAFKTKSSTLEEPITHSELDNESNNKLEYRKRKRCIGSKGSRSEIPRKGRGRPKGSVKLGMPRRPLSAYNLFFKEERAKMLVDDLSIPTSSIEKKVIARSHSNIVLVKKESVEALRKVDVIMSSKDLQTQERQRRKRHPHRKFSFENLAQKIGKKWREIDPEILVSYKSKALKEKERYDRELAAYHEKKST